LRTENEALKNENKILKNGTQRKPPTIDTKVNELSKTEPIAPTKPPASSPKKTTMSPREQQMNKYLP